MWSKLPDELIRSVLEYWSPRIQVYYELSGKLLDIREEIYEKQNRLYEDDNIRFSEYKKLLDIFTRMNKGNDRVFYNSYKMTKKHIMLRGVDIDPMKLTFKEDGPIIKSQLKLVLENQFDAITSSYFYLQRKM